jgi:hypothetical protein
VPADVCRSLLSMYVAADAAGEIGRLYSIEAGVKVGMSETGASAVLRYARGNLAASTSIAAASRCTCGRHQGNGPGILRKP